MITGFNTDIKHAERVYHVQTEDRGTANPIVESLVYVGGEILLSKKSPYKELMHGDRVDEKALREMMDLQHRRVIEAIRRGRLDSGRVGEVAPDWADEDTFPSSQKISLAARAAAAAILSAPSEPLPGSRSGIRPRAAQPVSSSAPPMPAAFAPRPAPAPREAPAPPPGAAAARPAPPLPLPAPAAAAPAPAPAPAVHAAPEPVPPSTTASRPRPTSGFHAPQSAPSQSVAKVGSGPQSTVRPVTGSLNTRSLDQVIVDYLSSEAASEHLELSLLLGGELIGGDSVPLTVRATTSLTDKPVPNTQVSIRVVSTTRPPQILFRGTTGADGFVKTTVTLPDIGAGNAALIVAASSTLGSNEVRQPVQRKR